MTADHARYPALEGDNHAAMIDVALVTVEQLVSALPDLHDDRAGLAGQPTHEVLWDRRPVRERLILVEDQLRDEFAHRGLVDEDFMVIGREATREQPGVAGLVVARMPSWRR